MTPPRQAACSCGQLQVEVAGDPVRVSMCHCLACQRRTGSAFGLQAGFPAGDVRMTGRHAEYARTSDEADAKVHVFRFCPDCGGTVLLSEPDDPEMVAVPVGAFADPGFPAPSVSVYGSRRHEWVILPDGIESDDAWAELQPLYESGRYAEAADRGGDLVAENPGNAQLAYNVACCAGLAGRTQEALGLLRRAVAIADDLRGLAAGDPDLDAIRAEPGFVELVG